MLSHHIPDSHSPTIDVNKIDATVNVAYGFGASPLEVRNFKFVIIIYIFIVEITTFNMS